MNSIIDFIKFRVTNSCNDLRLYYDRTYACINLNSLTLTITERCPIDILPYVLHHEYMHLILYDLIDEETTHMYDNVIEFSDLWV